MDHSQPDKSELIVVVRERPDLQRATSLAKPVVCLSYLRRSRLLLPERVPSGHLCLYPFGQTSCGRVLLSPSARPFLGYRLPS